MKISRLVTLSILLVALFSLFAAPALADGGGYGGSGNPGGWPGAPPVNPGAWAPGQHPHQNGGDAQSSSGVGLDLIVEFIDYITNIVIAGCL